VYVPPVYAPVPLNVTGWYVATDLQNGLPAYEIVAVGIGVTVTVAEVKQPVPRVYLMTDVPPETPVTTPPPDIVATPGDKLLQVPPPVALLSVVVDPAHRVVVPVITAGNGFIVSSILSLDWVQGAVGEVAVNINQTIPLVLSFVPGV
jgi:hypothetical protein